MKETPDQSEISLFTEVAEAFGLTEITDVFPLGGTATKKCAVTSHGIRYVVRIRPEEFSSAESITFDHACMSRLADADLPVPRPFRTPDGKSYLTREDQTYEVLSWVAGEPYRFGDEQTVSSAGSFLAKFHRTLENNIPDGKRRQREDHPDLVEPYAEALPELCRNEEERIIAQKVADEIQRVREHLDSGLYESLPGTVIHGDFHPGNVYFRNSMVSAVYDFDYVCLQARIRDVCDGLMFFASRREGLFQPDSIRSLTQAFRPDPALCTIFLRSYQETAPLADHEWLAMPWIIRSRWLQMRLRGGRKIPPQDRCTFITDRFFEVISWIDNESRAFFQLIRDYNSTEKTP